MRAVFDTARLVIRHYTAEDADFVFDMYSRAEVTRYLGGTPTPMHKPLDAVERIERWRGISAPNALFGVWAVALRETGQLVGTVMLKRIPLSVGGTLSDDHEVGWHLHPQHWGHGYATEAATGALRRGIDAGLSEVLALVKANNDPSKRVAERLGMQHVGQTARYYGIQAELYRSQGNRAGSAVEPPDAPVEGGGEARPRQIGHQQRGGRAAQAGRENKGGEYRQPEHTDYNQAGGGIADQQKACQPVDLPPSQDS